MKWMTTDDFTETYAKLVQRGFGFIASKFRLRGSERTLSAFNDSAIHASNWWIIPAVRRRWNRFMTGIGDTPYEDYIVKKYLQGGRDLSLLSLGSGTCSHEIRFARHPVFREVRCVDLAGNLLEKARKESDRLGLKNLVLVQGDARTVELEALHFDVILFHSSLHHFRDIDGLIGGRILNCLKEDGILVVNEYVGPNRLQYPASQIRAVNRALQGIPESYRRRYRLRMHKTRVSGPGFLRMLISDPSEAVESEKIMDTLEKYLEPAELKPYGGNLLMPVLKDIAHHFTADTPETERILGQLFEAEDQYLETVKSDFVFAVYRKRTKSPRP